ncbi:hypothetical protein QUF72_10320 [Desulfobacterales bacterium HSG2]|nr:hypothetical protein [Desulfobacterales bacterium HSG2]
MKTLFKAVLLTVMLLVSTAHAQGDDTLYFETLSVEDGLPLSRFQLISDAS